MSSIDLLPPGVLDALRSLAPQGGSRRVQDLAVTVAPEHGLVLLFPLLEQPGQEVAIRCMRMQLLARESLSDMQVALNAKDHACVGRRIEKDDFNDELMLQSRLLPLLKLIQLVRAS